MKKINLASNCCSSIFSRVIAPEQAREIAAIFKVLSEPARLQLISYIASQPQQEACVCELIEPLKLSQPTVSYHLKVLYQAGLLDKERRSNWIYYVLNRKQFGTIRNILSIAPEQPRR